LEKRPAKDRKPKSQGSSVGDHHAVRFLLDSLNATIYGSGDDYHEAIEEFFPQVQALGHLIGASSIDDVSSFIRDRDHW